MPTYDFDPTFDMSPAFPGMLADSGFTDKITLPANVAIPFGTAVTKTAGKAVLGAVPIGIAIADQALQGIYRGSGLIASFDSYQQYDAVSVLKTGRIWVLVAPTKVCTAEAVAKFDVAGMATDDGAYTMAHGRFLTTHFSWTSPFPGIGTRRVALVQLADPGIDNIGAS